MGRWKPDARARLEKAALALYRDRGFAQTTVADIAERAGLTERTFFRYFADKREVLFSGGEVLKQQLVIALHDAPKSLAAIDAVGVAVEGIAGFFKGAETMHVNGKRSSTKIWSCKSGNASSWHRSQPR